MKYFIFAGVVELADTLALGASVARREGSSPFSGTPRKKEEVERLPFFIQKYLDISKYGNVLKLNYLKLLFIFKFQIVNFKLKRKRSPCILSKKGITSLTRL